MSASRRGRLIAGAVLVCGVLACQSLFRVQPMDRRAFSLFYISLFNQQARPRLAPQNWAGDWLFRRERLLLVDQFLRNRKPDVAIFQQALVREGSSAESDLLIIGQGSLSGYKWDQEEVARYQATREVEYHALAAGLPLQPVALPSSFKRAWQLPEDGKATLFLLDWDGHQIPIFNVQMAREPKVREASYRELGEIIAKSLRSYQFCPLRLIVVGTLPASFMAGYFLEFKDKLGLRDVSEGFCEVPADCYSATPDNQVYLNANSILAPEPLDRVLVPKSAVVASATLVLKEPKNNARFKEAYGLDRLWASERFAWFSNMRLYQCDEGDYLTFP